jgi:hypothetical protein
LVVADQSAWNNRAVSTLPSRGWYDDPEYPGHVRYWDGSRWTDHRASKSPPASPTHQSPLPDIGDWLGDIFRTIADRRVAMFGLFVGLALSSLAFGVTVLTIWDDLAYIDGAWRGFSAGRVFATLAITFLIAVASMVVYLAAAHQLHEARLGRDPDIGSSVGAAIAAVPRTLGWALVLCAGALAAILGIAVVATLSAALAVVTALALAVLAIWLVVKLAFFATACVAPVPERNPFGSSSDVSKGRFWAVFGRLAVLMMVMFAVSIALNIAFSAFVSGPSQDDIDRLVQVDGDEVVFIDVGGLMEELDPVGPGVLIAALPGTITSAIALAGTALLFADTHRARREQDAHPA